MRVCIICEGSYPYVAGGVSSWVQMLISEYKDIEFVVWSIATSIEEMKEYKYQIPDNLKEIKTFYLNGKRKEGKSGKVKMTTKEIEYLKSLVLDPPNKIKWGPILDFLSRNKYSIMDIIMGKEFFHICVELYQKSYSRITFNSFLWNLRNMYLPLILVLSTDMPEADLYHAVSTGYAGILGGVASLRKNKPFILTEHGIYTREREEEIIKSDWVSGIFKEIWIDFFYKLSTIAYDKADKVITLFEANKNLQVELGCPSEKISIIPNGVDYNRFCQLPKKYEEEQLAINIGVVARVVPIKDIKTMLYAFDLVKAKITKVKLIILGPYEEDKEYYEECLSIVEELGLEGVSFEGNVDIMDYLTTFDMMLLTSISEGQPLAVLEGMAAGIPQICTNVGSCSELLYGKAEDQLGKAGLIVPIMNRNEIANAVLKLALNPRLRKEMGRIGGLRVEKYYQKHIFLKQYHDLYCEMTYTVT